VVGAYYRPPDQVEPTDHVFFLQLQETSHSQSLVLLGDFHHPNIHWKSSMASCRQPRTLLEWIEDNFLSRVIGSPTQGNAILDLMVTNASELISDVKMGASLGCSDHALVEFTVLRHMGKARTVVRTLNFRKANRPQVQGSGTELADLEGCFPTELKSSQSPGVRNQARKGRDQHG